MPSSRAPERAGTDSARYLAAGLFFYAALHQRQRIKEMSPGMVKTSTAHRVERWCADSATVLVPVAQLHAGDLVFDTEGFPHPLAMAEGGSSGSIWIQRCDLNYVEHLTGQIMVVRLSS